MNYYEVSILDNTTKDDTTVYIKAKSVSSLVQKLIDEGLHTEGKTEIEILNSYTETEIKENLDVYKKFI